MAVQGPLVTVVVPVFDTERLLPACLDSLAAQTYEAIEVVVVDDGSSDDSLAIARAYAVRAPERFTVVEMRHAGRAAARQEGVDRARGEFIGFVDADDWVDPTMYERLMDAVQSPAADVAICRYRNAGDDGSLGHVYEEGPRELYGGALLDNPALLDHIEASLCNKLFRRTLFDRVRFPRAKDFEDLATTYRLLGSARVIAKVEGPPLYFYRQGGPVSVMAAHDARYGDVVDALETTCSFFELAGTLETVRPQLLRMSLRHLVFSRFGGFFDRAGIRVAWPYLDRAYAFLDRRFPGWRHSDVLLARCGSLYSLTLVRSKVLMKAFVLARSAR